MALIINGSTFSGSYNNLSDKPTIPTNTNQLTNGAGFLTSAPAPTTSQVLSATAGLTAGAVGTYGMLWINGVSKSPGDTLSHGDLQFGPITGTSVSGTWRYLSKINDGNRVGVAVRIS